MYEEKGEFDAKVIQERLETLLVATSNKLDREWPIRYRHVDSARVVFFTRVRIAINTYSAIMYLIADTPKDPLRSPKFALAVQPLLRTLFEELITIIFLLHDIPKYIPYLFKSGYKEHWLELDYCLRYHATDPHWTDYINNLRKQMSIEAASLHLTPREIADPDNTIGRWPQPPKMLKILRRDHPASRASDFIEYINAWMYRKLSGQTHLDMTGLIQRGMHFSSEQAKLQFGDSWEEKLEGQLEYYRREEIYIMWTILLSIASEIEAHFHYDLNERVMYLWSILNEYSDITADFFHNRYKDLLA